MGSIIFYDLVAVKSASGRKALIRAEDFNPSVHELFEEEKAKAEPEEEEPKEEKPKAQKKVASKKKASSKK